MGGRHETTETDAMIRESGLRRTVPRAAVAAMLREHPGHHTVGQIEALIAAHYTPAPGIALSSIYRALEALERAGLVVGVRSGQEEARFEWEGDHAHHHLICERCGGVKEVSLDAARSLEREAHRQHGFTTRVRHLALRGTCAPCREDEPDAAKAMPATTSAR